MGNYIFSDFITHNYDHGHGFWIISLFTNDKIPRFKIFNRLRCSDAKIYDTRNCHFLRYFYRNFTKRHDIPIAKYNPIGYLIDSFNYMFVGVGSFDWIHIAYSGGFALVIFFFGILIFNQVEKNFMDTV